MQTYSKLMNINDSRNERLHVKLMRIPKENFIKTNFTLENENFGNFSVNDNDTIPMMMATGNHMNNRIHLHAIIHFAEDPSASHGFLRQKIDACAT